MKPSYLGLFFLIALGACTFSRKDEIKREHVLGDWEMVDSQPGMNPEAAYVLTGFKLKEDSTAILYYHGNEEPGSWLWKPEKIIFGGEDFGFSVKSDIALFANTTASGIPKLTVILADDAFPEALTTRNHVYEKK